MSRWEGEAEASVAVVRRGSLLGTVTVDYTCVDGTATAGSDYVPTSGTLVFQPGDSIRFFGVPLLNDALVEGDVILTVSLSYPRGATLGTASTATLTIYDDEGVTRGVEFSLSTAAVNEASGQAEVTVIRTGSLLGVVTVEYATGGGTATPGEDYTAVSGTLVMEHGESRKILTVPILDDSLFEENETVVLTLTDPSGLLLGTTQRTVLLTICDDERGFEFSVSAYGAQESSGRAEVTLVRAGKSRLPASVHLTMADGTAMAGLDYAATHAIIAFEAGESSKTIEIPLLDDAFVEGEETCALTLSNPSGWPLGTRVTAVLHITEDDRGIEFSSVGYNATEGEGHAVVTVSRAGTSLPASEVNFTTVQGTALEGEDFVRTSGMLHFEPGQTTHVIMIPIVNDARPEAVDSFTVVLSDPSGLLLGARREALVMIADDDRGIEFSFSAMSVWETAGQATVHVSRAGSPLEAVAVGYAVTEGSAKAGLDYTVVDGTLDFAIGETTKSFNITVLNDDLVEGNETINLALIDPSNLLLGAQRTAILRIDDDDRGIEFANTSFSVQEQAGSANLTVRRIGSPLEAVSVECVITGGSASVGSDYLAPPAALEFAAGETNKTLIIPILNDDVVEGNDTISFLLRCESSSLLGSQQTAILRIDDDDLGIEFASGTFSASEAAGELIVTLRRSGSPLEPISVNCVVAGGTASLGADFTAMTPTLDFAAGETNKTFWIRLVDDALFEGDETIALSLVCSAGPFLGSRSTSLCTIADDDFPAVWADTFENLDGWISFGDPSPCWLSEFEGRRGVFDNNGDDWYDSGAISKQRFDFSSGFVIESEIYLDLTSMDGFWACAVAGVADAQPADWGGYGPTLFFGLWGVWNEDDGTRHGALCASYPTEIGTETFWDPLDTPDGRTVGDGLAGRWVTLTIVVSPDGFPMFLADGVVFYEGTEPVSSTLRSPARRLYAGSRSSGWPGKAYHDSISYWKEELSTSEPPSMRRQPVACTSYAGGTVSFAAGVAGTRPLVYQWLRDDVSLVGATNRVLTLTNVQYADAGRYAVAVANAFGVVLSEAAVLTVRERPTLGQAVEQPGLAWVTSGDRGWEIGTDTTHDGQDAASSGRVGDYGNSRLTTTMMGPGQLAFWWKVASEPDYDYLLFKVDGVVQRAISGSVDWEEITVWLGPGAHEVEWVYTKDESVSWDQDRGWLDQVRFTGLDVPAVVSWPPPGQPAARVALVGQTVTLAVAAYGKAPLQYQWRKDGGDIPGATGSTLVLTDVQPADAGAYSALVSNDLGSATSEEIRLAVIALASLDFRIEALTTQNSRVLDHDGLTGDDRGGIALSTERLFVTGDAATASFHPDDLTGARSLGRVEDAMVSDLLEGTLYALGAEGAALRGPGTVTELLELDSVSATPTGRRVALSSGIDLPGDSGVFAGFGRVVLHDGSRFYQILLPSGSVEDLGPLPSPEHTGSENWAWWGVAEYFDAAVHVVYVRDSQTMVRCRISDGSISVVAQFSDLSDMASLTVDPFRQRWYFHHEGGSQFGGGEETVGMADAVIRLDTADAPPQILRQPQSQTVAAGQTVTLRVAALATAPVSYQWRKNGLDLAGATDASLRLASVQLGDAGHYSVLVSNPHGSVPSAEVTLAVLDRPTLGEALNQPGLTWETSGNRGWEVATEDSRDGLAAWSGTVGHNQSSRLSTTVTGPGLVSFWWRVDSEWWYDFLRFSMDGVEQEAISGWADWRSYAAWVGEGSHILEWAYTKDGSDTWGQDRGWLDQVSFVGQIPVLLTSPQGRTARLGSRVVFRVTAQGTPPLSYQWHKDGIAIAEATSSTLTLEAVGEADSGRYSVAVSNAQGTIVSTEAVLVVLPFAYERTGSTVAILRYLGAGGAVGIPAAIEGLPVTSIDDHAFTGCANVTSLRVPSTVVQIGRFAFLGCPNLVSVEVEPGNPVYSSADGVLFNRERTALLRVPEGRTGSYAIPAGVTSLEWLSFYGCTGLRQVTIPDSVRTIGLAVFAGCTGLSEVTIGRGVGSIWVDAFERCPSLNAIYFRGNAPASAGDVFPDANPTVYYLPGTWGWGSTYQGQPTAPWYQPAAVVLTSGAQFGGQPGGFGFVIAWATNTTFVVEACTDLAAPLWTPVATNKIVAGQVHFLDEQWTNFPARFYRVRSP